jgi:hypothetical protein
MRGRVQLPASSSGLADNLDMKPPPNFAPNWHEKLEIAFSGTMKEALISNLRLETVVCQKVYVHPSTARKCFNQL